MFKDCIDEVSLPLTATGIGVLSELDGLFSNLTKEQVSLHLFVCLKILTSKKIQSVVHHIVIVGSDRAHTTLEVGDILYKG